MFIFLCCFFSSLNASQNEELDKKYAGLLEKKWTSVIRLQKKVSRDVLDIQVQKVSTESIQHSCMCSPEAGEAGEEVPEAAVSREMESLCAEGQAGLEWRKNQCCLLSLAMALEGRSH